MIAMESSQRGQSTTEFLIALVALVPIFLAIIYAGRYSDIQFAAVQASRYAAMQRAMQPNTARLPEARLEEQVRARFFVHGARSQGVVRSDDTTAQLDARATTPLWRDMAGEPLLRTLDSARLVLSGSDLTPRGPSGAAVNVMTSLAGKTYSGATIAPVELSDLVNKMDQRTPDPAGLSIGATTAAAGDGLGSSGSTMTRDVAARLVPTRWIPPEVNRVVGAAFRLFEPSAPVFGCVKPDLVPSGRLDRPVAPQACQ